MDSLDLTMVVLMVVKRGFYSVVKKVFYLAVKKVFYLAETMALKTVALSVSYSNRGILLIKK